MRHCMFKHSMHTTCSHLWWSSVAPMNHIATLWSCLRLYALHAALTTWYAFDCCTSCLVTHAPQRSSPSFKHSGSTLVVVKLYTNSTPELCQPPQKPHEYWLVLTVKKRLQTDLNSDVIGSRQHTTLLPKKQGQSDSRMSLTYTTEDNSRISLSKHWGQVGSAHWIVTTQPNQASRCDRLDLWGDSRSECEIQRELNVLFS